MKNNIDERLYYNKDFLENIVFPILTIYSQLEIDLKTLSSYSTKEKYILEKIKQIYSKVFLYKDYKSYQLNYFPIEDTIGLANSYLISLFPNKKNEILELDSLIKVSNLQVYDACLNYKFTNRKINLDNILIPNVGSNYMVSTIAHEKIHALTFNNTALVDLFQNGLELLPLLIQKIILYEIGDELSSVLDSILRANDLKQSFKYLKLVKQLKNNPNKTEADNYVCDYFSIKIYEYLIGELYSSLLLNYYQLDKEKMIIKLNQIFNNKITISEFLNSYNISLTNKELIPIIKEKNNKCKRINIIL